MNQSDKYLKISFLKQQRKIKKLSKTAIFIDHDDEQIMADKNRGKIGDLSKNVYSRVIS